MKLKRLLYLILGCICLGPGCVGIALPYDIFHFRSKNDKTSQSGSGISEKLSDGKFRAWGFYMGQSRLSGCDGEIDPSINRETYQC